MYPSNKTTKLLNTGNLFKDKITHQIPYKSVSEKKVASHRFSCLLALILALHRLHWQSFLPTPRLLVGPYSSPEFFQARLA